MTPRHRARDRSPTSVRLLGQGWLGGDKLGTAGALTAAVCRRCGYSELYTSQPERIPIDGTYVREVIGSRG